MSLAGLQANDVTRRLIEKDPESFGGADHGPDQRKDRTRSLAAGARVLSKLMTPRSASDFISSGDVAASVAFCMAPTTQQQATIAKSTRRHIILCPSIA